MALTGLFFISNLFVFGGTALFSPFTAFPNAGEGAIFPIQFFAIRHVAFAFPLLYGLVTRNRTVLITMFSIFFIMSGLDILWLYIYDYNIPIVGLIPAIANLSALGKVIVGILGLFAPTGIALWYLVYRVEG